MANQIPLSGLTSAAGGVLLPPEQGEILANGVLQRTAAFEVAGDVRTTSSRRTEFPIWKGEPSAGFVGEGGVKPVTGAEFGAGTLNVKKIASIVLFTDEQIEDVQNGDLNVLVDTNVRKAIARVADAHAVGRDKGSAVSGSFDTELADTSASVELGTNQDALALAVSAAMGTLEANGYDDPADMALILAADAARHIRDARQTSGGTATATAQAQALYRTNVDPTYGLQTAFSTNLNKITAAGTAGNVVGLLVYKPNLHVRVRKDVEVSVSREASVQVEGEEKARSLWQENLTGLRYETRIGFMAHDLNRAVVAIKNES